MRTQQQAPSLSPAQIRVVVALAGGLSISAAAREADIARSTIHDWIKNDSEFKSKYDIIRQNIEQELYDQILELRTLALGRLKAILENPDASPSVQLRAALAVLKDTLNPPPPPKQAAQPPQLDKIRQNPTLSSTVPATPRNALCPCGSGDKYKRCCGRHAPPVLSAAAA